ncbi:formylmethanofuran dehydrogenase subunit B [Methanothermobacter sp. KEPCO-1]|uniref:formylmethanofuran dehydrogenase subunit B n=2 Tax=Methanobacteriaceae TaxID=2159 RepID=D9PU56_METTM|nr:tungsten formylmethanofuran dehydrogenase, subunit B [Methanothermobacter marburgensis str. Marburg]QEF94361.1 formylmethanofuran dehydrogenase subunit B [Methanothermobacter sp. KEPCO-1]WBF09973.1 formylmethanofuran dehydrogenase subunit B [Methanothermobacter marburgensis]
MEYVKNVVCPFCGTLCDDIICKVEDNEIVGTINACRIGHSKFVHAEGAVRYKKPLIRKNGEFVEVSYDEAIDKAAKILAESKRPLMYGWSCTECEAQAVGVELAEEAGAVIDNTASVCHGPSVLALQDVGYPICTFGEVKNRADVVVYWGCNPMHAHPRHMSRNVFARGFFRERGRSDRTLIVVDPRKTDSAKLADIHLQLDFDRDYELLDAMRAYLLGNEILYDEVAGVPREQIEEAVEVLKKAQFGILFFGMGITHSRGKHRNIDTAIMMVEDLNDYAKWTLIPMRGHYNVTGFNQVCTWESGYPYCVDFSEGEPRYNPGETGANDLLQNREADAMMVIASDPGAHFPQRALERMAEIPVIAIEPHRTPTTELADIIIPPAIVGMEAEGTAYRMEGVPIRMKKVVDSDLLSDREILERLLEKVREYRASK